MFNLIKFVVVMVLGAFSGSALAYPITDVGIKDDLLAAESLKNSGEATEEKWIEDVLGFDIDYAQLGSISDSSYWESVVGGELGDYAFQFDDGFNPEYFLIKLGGGKGAGADDTHYLYDNLASMEYAFINLSDFGEGVTLTNFGIISHAGTSGGTSVPEPGVIGLLAIGLLGVVARRRFKV
jgi:hypothetical protein